MSAIHPKPQDGIGPPAGKQRLIEAALRLAARDGITLSSLGLRELAREAGLNHNTFYRHFRHPEELGQAAAEEIAAQLMAGLKEVRLRAARHADATVGAVEYFFDFVLANPDVFAVGARELHSLASPMRAVLMRVMDAIAQESVAQIAAQNLVPVKDHAQLHEVTLDIAWHMFSRSLEVIDRPQDRKRLGAQLVSHIRRQFLGTMAAQQLGKKKSGAASPS